MSTKVFKIELMVIDFDGIGAESIKGVLENTRYPNRCIYTSVQGMEHRTVEWSDDHPLNMRSTKDQAYKDMFSEPKGD